jgi:phenylalanyl-tRNA synthetase beta chain
LRVPLSWLREYVDFDLSADELVELISLRVQEVDGVSRLGVLEGEVMVGEVQEFGPHPDADRLFVAKVDIGGRVVQIVAGAPNPYPGAKVPVVLPGSLMADGTKLRKAKLRGLESYGMMMSERELGISPDHGGILLLDDSFEVGHPVADYFPVGETVLEIDVFPNRPDLWGMIGVSRELAAVLETGHRAPAASPRCSGEPTGAYGLRVEAGDLCPRYDLRRVSGVAPAGRAPLWMRQRVYAAGMRPINAIVDATNYVMLETGQPIHAFDADKVREGIVVRRAREGERMTLLDGSTRVLDGEVLLIADEEKGLVIAGVMGAEDAEVGDETTDVLVEVATFDGTNIMQTSQRLGLRTDASGRFERGLDPNMVGYTMDRVTALISSLCGGLVADDTLSHYPEPVEPWRVPLRIERAELLLGIPVDLWEAASRLTRLGLRVEKENGHLSTTVPTFRGDLRREEDLIEEVGRLIGLEKVPEALPEISQPGGLTPSQKRLRRLRHVLVDVGFAEALTYPFGPDRWLEDFGTGERGVVRVGNPLSAEGKNLRATILPGLLDAVARNRSFGSRGAGLFEVGNVFEPHPAPEGLRETAIRFRITGETDRLGPDAEPNMYSLMGVREIPKVGLVLAGSVRPAGWNVLELEAGFFLAKGIVERLVPGSRFEPGESPFLHPGRSAVVWVDEREAGWVGELHPEVIERFELEGWPVAAFELDLALCEPDPTPRFEPFVNIPTVNRDLAVVVASSVPVGGMLAAIEALRSPILAETRVFDVYEKPPVPEGHKSVALSFTFQGEETLTDEDVSAEIRRIAIRLEEGFEAKVRARDP